MDVKKKLTEKAALPNYLESYALIYYHRDKGQEEAARCVGDSCYLQCKKTGVN